MPRNGNRERNASVDRNRSDWVTIYSGRDTSARSLAEYLAARSIDVREHATRGPIVSKPGRRARRVRVQVPPEQTSVARSFYEEWRLPHEARAREASHRLLVMLCSSLVVPAVWVLAYCAGIPDVPAPRPGRVIGVWMVSLVGIAWIGNRRRRAERIDRPT